MSSAAIKAKCGEKTTLSTANKPHDLVVLARHTARMDTDALLRRIEQRLLELGMSDREASLSATGSVNTIRSIRRGSIPGIDKIVALARVLGVSVDWLSTGDFSIVETTVGPDFASQTIQDNRTGKKHEVKYGDPKKDTLGKSIPEVDVRAGMGGGGESTITYVPDGNGGMAAADDVRAQWTLPEDYLNSELRVSARMARIIEVQGDSMEPTLRAGDRVMVNLADRRPSPPGIFALWDGFGVVVKRIEHIPNSDPPTMKVKSDNQYHDVYERTSDEVNIIGRVVWYARRI